MKHIKLITKVVSVYIVDKFYTKANSLIVATGGSFSHEVRVIERGIGGSLI
jgi:hypothetical protein